MPSLVGSEMCIRDRQIPRPVRWHGCSGSPAVSLSGGPLSADPGVAVDGTVEGFPVIADFVGVVGDITRIGPVSYTHLTLPTIYSV